LNAVTGAAHKGSILRERVFFLDGGILPVRQNSPHPSQNSAAPPKHSPLTSTEFPPIPIPNPTTPILHSICSASFADWVLVYRSNNDGVGHMICKGSIFFTSFIRIFLRPVNSHHDFDEVGSTFTWDSLGFRRPAGVVNICDIHGDRPLAGHSQGDPPLEGSVMASKCGCCSCSLQYRLQVLFLVFFTGANLCDDLPGDKSK